MANKDHQREQRAPPDRLPEGVRPAAVGGRPMAVPRPTMLHTSNSNSNNAPLLRYKPNLVALSQVPPYTANMSEEAFFNSLVLFTGAFGLPLRRPLTVGDRVIPLKRLYELVTGMGGWRRVSELGRWPMVAMNVGLDPATAMATLASLYHTILHPYEQFFQHRVPPEQLESKPWCYLLVVCLAQKTPEANAPPLNSATPAASAGLSRPPSTQRLTTPHSAASGGTARSPVQAPATPSSGQTQTTALPKPRCLEALPLEQLRLLPRLRHPPLALTDLGRITWAQLGRCLAGGNRSLRRYALDALQTLSCNPNIPPPLDRDLALLLAELVPPVHGLETHDMEEGGSPFELWRREANAIFAQPESEPWEWNTITNILRSWSLHPETARQMVGIWPRLWPRLLSPLSSESDRNLWLALAQMPTTGGIHVDPALLPRLLDRVAGEWLWLAREVRGSVRRIAIWIDSPTMALLPVDSLQKIIQSYGQAAQTLTRLLPASLPLQMEACLRLQKPEWHGDLAQACWELLRLFIVPALTIVRAIVRFLAHPQAREQMPQEHASFIVNVLHGPAFGLGDGGILELALCLLEQLATVGEAELAALLSEADLLAIIACLRSLWEAPIPAGFTLPHPTTAKQQRGKQQEMTMAPSSPLLSAAQLGGGCHSHPYALLVRLYRLTDALLPYNQPIERLYWLERLAEWSLWEHATFSPNTEVLGSLDLRRLNDSLLQTLLNATELIESPDFV